MRTTRIIYLNEHATISQNRFEQEIAEETEKKLLGTC